MTSKLCIFVCNRTYSSKVRVYAVSFFSHLIIYHGKRKTVSDTNGVLYFPFRGMSNHSAIFFDMFSNPPINTLPFLNRALENSIIMFLFQISLFDLSVCFLAVGDKRSWCIFKEGWKTNTISGTLYSESTDLRRTPTA